MATLSAGELLDRLRGSDVTLSLVEIDGSMMLDVRGSQARPLLDDLRFNRDEIILRLTPPATSEDAYSNLIESFGGIEIVGDEERRILTRSILSIAAVRQRLRESGATLARTTFVIAWCPDCDGLSISTRRRADLRRRCPNCLGWQGREDDSDRGKRRRVFSVIIRESDYSRPRR